VQVYLWSWDRYTVTFIGLVNLKKVGNLGHSISAPVVATPYPYPEAQYAYGSSLDGTLS